MKIYELLDSPDKWCKGNLAVNKSNEPVMEDEKSACKWCLIGALYKCYSDSTQIVLDTEYLLSKKLRVDINEIEVWNDDPNTTYEDVIKLCKELDI